MKVSNKMGIALFAFCSLALSNPVELILWHSMAGQLDNEVQRLAKDFNQSQNQFMVKPVYKGDYIETLTSFAAAFRAKQAPAMVQIFEVGTAIMLSPKGIIKPVDVLMKEQDIPLPTRDFLPSVREFYSRKGRLMAMPFNLSIPLLYYNLDILKQVGYNKTNFPKTWDELEVLAEKIKKAGYDCTYTTSYPGWILVESFLAIHGLSQLQAFSSPELTRHFQRLNHWHQLGYFRYGGRVDDATVFFTSEICPLLSQSSGAYNSLVALVPFSIGIAPMPLDTQASLTRHANVVGGAALWAVAGQHQQRYQGIAQFFAFLAQAKIQKHWHEHTGYLPLGLTGIYANILQSSKHPTLLLARDDLSEKSQENNPLLSELPQNQIRNMNDEILEAMFAGLIDVKTALQKATNRTQHLLQRFSHNTQDFPR